MIRTFIRNPVAANMLMILILGSGLAASFLIPREVFPEFSIGIVTVSVPYPGASPEDTVATGASQWAVMARMALGWGRVAGREARCARRGSMAPGPPKSWIQGQGPPPWGR